MAVFTTAKSFYKKFKFTVEIDGIRSASFQSMSDLAGEVAVVEHYEGGAIIPNKCLGRATFPNITLMRGATSDRDIYDWFQQCVSKETGLNGTEYKRNLEIVQRARAGGPNAVGEELRRWTIWNAFPVRFKAGDWDNDTDEVTIEEVELAYDYYTQGNQEFSIFS